ncbi:MAG: SusF/SusE family outer membrane protein [Prevotella sp.]|nr:SusF/SusE family outer membrane protein [Prevotella sp.]MDY4037865.1 SusF/SusE family outer membrane protein [Prevotella sp.]
MKKRVYQLLAFLMFVCMTGCIDNNIGYDDVTNVPEGIYITGSNTEFSVEASKGMLQSIDNGVLYCINVWLKQEGVFYISYVDESGQPVRMGFSQRLSDEGNAMTIYSLKAGGDGISVGHEGLYQVVLNKEKAQVNIIPYNFRIRGKFDMTEDGQKEISMSDVSYDKINHIVTWTTGKEARIILPSEFTFAYTDSQAPITVEGADGAPYEIASFYTGMAGNVKMNTLTADYSKLTNQSSVNLNLRRKGNYVVTLRYNVLNNQFAANIQGEEMIEPEATGFPPSLYMAGDEWGAFGSAGMVRMAPVGVTGNGAFWTMGYFTEGKAIRWSANPDGSDSFSSLGSQVGLTVDAQGKAAVTKSGYYVVFIDMNRKIIAFEEPELYGIGECFGGNEQRIAFSNGEFRVTTTSEGRLQMYAASLYNNRDWNSMEFNIINGKIVYRGVGELDPVPVNKGIPVSLDLKLHEGGFIIPTDVKAIPTSANELCLIADNIANGNWGSQGVVSMWNTWGNKQTFFYLHHFKKGMKISVSTSKVFGKNEFAALIDNKGNTLVDGRAVIPHDGVYMVYVDLSTRAFHLLDAEVYAYGTAANDNGNKHLTPFTLNADKKSMSLTLPADGRLRIDPASSALTSSGAWKRELYFEPEGGQIKLRAVGEPEPNQKYIWKAGTKITLNFETMQATVEQP